MKSATTQDGLGLIVGIVLGLFLGNFWTTLLYAVLIGAGIGLIANVLGWISDTMRRRSN